MMFTFYSLLVSSYTKTLKNTEKELIVFYNIYRAITINPSIGRSGGFYRCHGVYNYNHGSINRRADNLQRKINIKDIYERNCTVTLCNTSKISNLISTLIPNTSPLRDEIPYLLKYHTGNIIDSCFHILIISQLQERI